MIYLLHGFIASGKTTQAREIERLCDAVRITPDEWMARLFGVDPPEALFRPGLDALLDLLRPIWTALARQGAEVVLDYGFWTRADRAAIEAHCIRQDLAFQWIRINTSLAECRRRNALRNLGDTKTLNISDATFDSLARGFEPMEPDPV